MDELDKLNFTEGIVFQGKLCAVSEIIEKNSSFLVFLNGNVLKILKSVYGATIAERKRALLEEFRINFELSPSIYLGVHPVLARQASRDGKDWVDDYALLMRKLSKKDLVLELLRKDLFNQEQATLLADKLAEFHLQKRAGNFLRGDKTLIKKFGSLQSRQKIWFSDLLFLAENKRFLSVKTIVAFNRVKRFILDFLSNERFLLLTRKREGFVLPLHGEMKDLAFFVLDLDFFQKQAEKEIFLSVYQKHFGFLGPQKLFDFYLCNSVIAACVANFKRG
ncbi:hypothetical protein L6252_02300 [Candidatus Parcubacteria bacterium]|nr:hypothetical protein [Candidatus Parcubacteria bacterium]